MSIGVLNYRGNAGVDDMSAFNARFHQTWRGDNLFRVFPLDGKLYFIRVGGSKQSNVAVGAQFGLIGALFIYFSLKRAAKKTQETLNTIAGAHPADLLPGHKYNFVMESAEIQSAAIHAGGFFSGSNVGRCTMIDANGKKRNLTFDDVENMRTALAQLGLFLGDRLTVNVEWNEAKKKYRKK